MRVHTHISRPTPFTSNCENTADCATKLFEASLCITFLSRKGKNIRRKRNRKRKRENREQLAHYKTQLDPTVEEVKKLCTTCRKYAKWKSSDKCTLILTEGVSAKALAGMYMLSNVASGNEFHKEAVMDQLFPQIGDNIQSIMIKFLQSNDSMLRTACVWTVVNLTFPSSPSAHSRVAKLQNACITSQLKDMVNDPCLDVKSPLLLLLPVLRLFRLVEPATLVPLANGCKQVFLVLNVLKRISDEDCKLLGSNPKYARPDWMKLQ